MLSRRFSFLHWLSVLALATALTFLLPGCVGGRTGGLVGKWEKLPQPTATPAPTPTPGGGIVLDLSLLSGILSCDMLYPQNVEFFRDSTYAGQVGTLWGGGEYKVLADGRLRLATAMGGVSVYRFAVAGSELTITDDSGCQFRYRRMK